MDEDEWLTTEEVAARLRVTRQTVGRWIREGKLRAFLLRTGMAPGMYRIRVSEFRAFVRRYVRDEF